MKYTKLFESNFNFQDVFHFAKEKTLLQSEEVFSRWKSAKQLAKTRGRCKLQAPPTGGNFGAKLAHFYGF